MITELLLVLGDLTLDKPTQLLMKNGTLILDVTHSMFMTHMVTEFMHLNGDLNIVMVLLF